MSKPEESTSSMFRERQPKQFCAEYPLRDDFTAQVLIPRDLTAQEAARMYRFIMALAQPEKGKP